MIDKNAPWIEIKNLYFYHGQQKILSDINLLLYPGCHYILAGPNGAGKSTLVDILANLKKAAKGCIMLKGQAIQNYKPRDLAQTLSLAPQDFRLNFSFTVREVVSMGRRPYLGRWGLLGPDDHKAVDEAICLFKLEKLAHKAVTALSGGEKQRVIAARTIAQATPIILLDEPSSNLDIAHALALMELAQKKAEEGFLVITVTHDLNLAASFGHQFIFLKDGALMAAGPKEATFTAEILKEIYEAEAQVSPNDFTGGLAAFFRLSHNLRSEI